MTKTSWARTIEKCTRETCRWVHACECARVLLRVCVCLCEWGRMSVHAYAKVRNLVDFITESPGGKQTSENDAKKALFYLKDTRYCYTHTKRIKSLFDGKTPLKHSSDFLSKLTTVKMELLQNNFFSGWNHVYTLQCTIHHMALYHISMSNIHVHVCMRNTDDGSCYIFVPSTRPLQTPILYFYMCNSI